jgi:hypothetical protein
VVAAAFGVEKFGNDVDLLAFGIDVPLVVVIVVVIGQLDHAAHTVLFFSRDVAEPMNSETGLCDTVIRLEIGGEVGVVDDLVDENVGAAVFDSFDGQMVATSLRVEEFGNDVNLATVGVDVPVHIVVVLVVCQFDNAFHAVLSEKFLRRMRTSSIGVRGSRRGSCWVGSCWVGMRVRGT